MRRGGIWWKAIRRFLLLGLVVAVFKLFTAERDAVAAFAEWPWRPADGSRIDMGAPQAQLPREPLQQRRPDVAPQPPAAAATQTLGTTNAARSVTEVQMPTATPPAAPKVTAAPARSPAAELKCHGCCNDGYALSDCLDVDACAAAGPKEGRYAFVLSYINVPREVQFLPYIASMRAKAAAMRPHRMDILLVMPEKDAKRLNSKQLAYLQENDVKLMQVKWVLPPKMRFTREKQWCGPKDLVRLHAFGYEEYDAVVYYDSDIEFRGDLTPVLRCAATGRFLTTNGLDGVPLNIGFFAVRPDVRLLRASELFARTAEYNDSKGWAGSGFLPSPRKFRTAECGQGFLHTLLYKRDSAMAKWVHEQVGLGGRGFIGAQVNQCIWNYQGTEVCPDDFDCALVRAHHKSPKWTQCTRNSACKAYEQHSHECLKLADKPSDAVAARSKAAAR